MAWTVRTSSDHGLRPVLPFALTLLLVLIGAMPLRAPGFAEIAPALPLVSLFYWSVFSRDSMSPPAAFVLGVLNDIVTGTPLGLSPFVYLVVQGIGASQRRFFLGKPFLVAWWGFSFIAVLAQAVGWALASLLYWKALPATESFFAALMTVAAYPPLSWGFARIQLALLDGR